MPGAAYGLLTFRKPRIDPTCGKNFTNFVSPRRFPLHSLVVTAQNESEIDPQNAAARAAEPLPPGGAAVRVSKQKWLRFTASGAAGPGATPPHTPPYSGFAWLTRQLQLAVAGSQCELP